MVCWCTSRNSRISRISSTRRSLDLSVEPTRCAMSARPGTTVRGSRNSLRDASTAAAAVPAPAALFRSAPWCLVALAELRMAAWRCLRPSSTFLRAAAPAGLLSNSLFSAASRRRTTSEMTAVLPIPGGPDSTIAGPESLRPEPAARMRLAKSAQICTCVLVIHRLCAVCTVTYLLATSHVLGVLSSKQTVPNSLQRQGFVDLQRWRVNSGNRALSAFRLVMGPHSGYVDNQVPAPAAP